MVIYPSQLSLQAVDRKKLELGGKGRLLRSQGGPDFRTAVMRPKTALGIGTCGLLRIKELISLRGQRHRRDRLQQLRAR
jgi:hypothetical protein